MTYIVPQIVDVLIAQERNLPYITVVLIVISEFIRDWGTMLLTAVITLFFLFTYTYSYNYRFKYFVDATLLKLPIIGNFIKLGESALFASTMQIAISGGVSMIKSLKISSRVIGNKKLKESLKEVTTLVREGAELGRSLGKVGQFSPLLVQLISTGEKSGELVGMLEVVSIQLSNQLKHKALRLTVFLEPLMILFMGGIVLLIVLAVMMPLIEMNSIM
jgi:general secretion pathway protein F